MSAQYFHGNTLQVESLHIKLSPQLSEFALSNCTLTTLRQACSPVSVGQQDDLCELTCPNMSNLDLQMYQVVAHRQAVFQQGHLAHT